MFDLIELIKAAGYLGLFGIVFAETGLLVGFFLPGDSLMFTAGVLAAEGYLNIYILLIILVSAAIIGDSTGYAIGKKFGPKIFAKENSLLFNKSHVQKAEQFFHKHGPKTIIIARFVPIVRTFVPTLAGVGKMSYWRFLTYNIVGALLWAAGLTLLGYYLGLKIDNIDKYILPIIAVIILVSISPYIKRLITDKNLRREIYIYAQALYKRIFSKK
ncbi:VTT domain-containing protein [bacterium]|nr:MAG: VTT domain-containing protein [bacterium]